MTANFRKEWNRKKQKDRRNNNLNNGSSNIKERDLYRPKNKKNIG